MKPLLQWKIVSVTYAQSVSAALVIKHAVRVRHFVICGLCCCTVFFPYYLINDTVFEKKLLRVKCVF